MTMTPVAVSGLALAFRRADYTDRGPLDEHFALDAYLDAWWSLSAIGAVMCLGLGYGWVLATVIARRILSGIIR
mgnify:CR=1 FL=1